MINKNNRQKKYWNGIIIFLFLLPILGQTGIAENVKDYSNLKTLIGHSDSINCIAWSPDGKKIASISIDNTTKIWDATTGNSLNTINGTGQEWNLLSWSPDGSKIITAGRNRTGFSHVFLWDSFSGIKLIDYHEINNSISMAWNPNGKQIAFGTDLNSIFILNTTTNENNFTISGRGDRYDGHIESVAWNSNGTLLASGTQGRYNRTVDIWNGSDGKNKKNRLFEGSAFIRAMAWRPNSYELAFASYNIILIWNYLGNQDDIVINLKGEINTIAWSPDGNELAYGDSLSNIGIWDMKTNTNLINLTGHTSGIASVAWDYSGHYLASGSGDNTIKIWGEPSPPTPNIYVRSINSDKNEMIAGNEVNITVVLSNNGTADGIKKIMYLFDGINIISTREFSVLKGQSISFEFQWNVTESTSLGIHDFRAVVGTSEKKLTINILGYPNIYVENVSVNKKNIIVGENITINATIKNNGSATAINVSVKFYDGTDLIETRIVNVSMTEMINESFDWNTKYAQIGTHTLKVIVGPSMKETTVRINNHPTIILNYSISAWLIGLIILLIVIISLILGYDAYKKKV